MHTLVVSDLHLSEAQEIDPKRPLWMAYKHARHFVDDDFARFLDHVVAVADGPVELVLNGDIFDFDNIITLPEAPEGRIDGLARLRGLGSEEWMSRFKIARIIADHPVFFDALRGFVAGGHRVIFITGNHDLELHWPSVQGLVREAIGVPGEAPPHDAPSRDGSVTFCTWFYLSEGDTFITHGHQYDPLCAVPDMIEPFIEVDGKPRVRIAFGDLAERYMLNGMGYFNPHASSNYIMSLGAYVRFFFRYMVRTQPLLAWSWLWSAVVTLVVSLRDHWRPALRDPLRVDDRVAAIAANSRATPSMVRQLQALDVAPASAHQPLAIIRELWLDRAFLLAAVLAVAWQAVLHVNIAWPVSPWWGLLALVVLLPPYFVYATRVKSGVFSAPLLDAERAALIHRITDADTVVMGHTHEPVDTRMGPVRYINGGFWSPAFDSPDCRRRIGTQTFVWIRPRPRSGLVRSATLYAWPPGAGAPVPYQPPASVPRGTKSLAPPPPLASKSA
ncbi:MAG: metallophosphoesterase [Myxococcota bacterium]